MKEFFVNVLSSGGKISSKRFITFLAFIMLVIGFIGNMFYGLMIDPEILDSFRWIVLGGLGFTASEQFSGKKPPPSSPNDDFM